MNDKIKSIEVFTLTLNRDIHYLGATGEGENINEKGYFVRDAN